MNIKTSEQIGLTLLSLALLGLLAYWVFPIKVFGSAPSGLPTGFASTSQIAITAGTVSLPVASSSVPTANAPIGCSSRIVATASTTVMVGIGNMVPTASLGYFVAASTTKEFDSGIYGCGALKIYPFSTGAISVTDNY